MLFAMTCGASFPLIDPKACRKVTQSTGQQMQALPVKKIRPACTSPVFTSTETNIANRRLEKSNEHR